jgi:hypothetical protein
MRTCTLCSSDIPLTVVIDGVERNLQRRKYCLVCSPFGAHNTRSLRRDDDGSLVVVSVKREGASLICTRCFRVYVFAKKQGHTLTLCNSCVANRQRTRVKRRCVEYKGGKCQSCGYCKSMRVLSFHHRDPEQKEFSIAGKMTWAWARLMKELDKCDLLCANCHLETHDEEFTLG